MHWKSAWWAAIQYTAYYIQHITNTHIQHQFIISTNIKSSFGFQFEVKRSRAVALCTSKRGVAATLLYHFCIMVYHCVLEWPQWYTQLHKPLKRDKGLYYWEWKIFVNTQYNLRKLCRKTCIVLRKSICVSWKPVSRVEFLYWVIS